MSKVIELSDTEMELLYAGTEDMRTTSSVFEVAAKAGRNVFFYGSARTSLARKGLVVAYHGGFYVLTSEGVAAVERLSASDIVF